MSKKIVTKILDKSLDALLSNKWQIKAACHILNRARGEGNDDSQSNGEYFLLDKITNYYQNKKFIAFDVGANLGEWSLRLAQSIGQKGQVYAFEPSQATYRRLQEQIQSQKFGTQVIANNVGLSDKSGLAQFFVCAPTAGTNSLYKRQAQALGVKQQAQEEVVLKTGDEFCHNLGIEHIDLIKIDTEGHEMAVLKGFSWMLFSQKIDMIQFEYGGCWVDARVFLVDAFNFLLSKGYYCGKIFPSGIKIFTAYDQRLDNFSYSNYIVFKPDNELINGLEI